MYRLGYYPASGSLITTNKIVSFDPLSGYALFKNLKITKSGMYLLSLNVFTTNSEYNSTCYSNLITVLGSADSVQTYDQTAKPDYILTFAGNYSAINPNEIVANVYNFIKRYGLSVNGISSYAGSVIVTFYSTDSNPSLIKALTSSGVNVSTGLNFVSVQVNGITYNCTNCIVSITSLLSSFSYNKVNMI